MNIQLNTPYPSRPVAPMDRADILPHSHSVQFYGADAFLIEELGRFIGPALGAGNAAIVIATKAHRDALAKLLESRGFDLTLASVQGRYTSLDAAEVLARFMVDGQPDPARFSTVIGATIARSADTVKGEGGHVVAFGEMVALLWAGGKVDAAIELEELWNGLSRMHSFDLHCAYPMGLFGRAADGAPIERIFAAHSHVIPAEDYTVLGDEEARSRAITQLQQKARALETEVEERKKVQRSLARREAELADFLENALEGVQQIDADQVIMWANKAVLRLLGYTPKEYMGRPFSDFVVGKAAAKKFWQKLMRHEDIYDYPMELRCKDGSTRHVLFHANGLWEDDKLVHARCFIHDVTEQKAMEQRLIEKNRELAGAVLAREEFLSVAAHELKTPITSLRGFAQLLLRDINRDQQISEERLATGLRAIDMQTGKLGHLMSRLLDSTQIDAGKLRIEPASTDLAALVRGVLAQQRVSTEHNLVYTGPEQLEAVVDPVRFEQGVTNLVDNALKFSPSGGEVKVALEEGADRTISLSVTDHGVGVAPEEREAIFRRFHQSTGGHHLSGMGLGLYITREIVELHGGSIRAEVPEHQGSRFVVTLPASAASSRSDPAPVELESME